MRFLSTGLLSVDRNRVMIDFYDGVIIDHNGNKIKMVSKLRGTEYEVCRSLLIYNEHTVHVKTIRKGHLNTVVFPGTFILNDIVFDVLEFEIYQKTNLYVAGHTSPTGIHRAYISENKEGVFLDRGTLTAGQEKIIDIRASLQRDATSGYVSNLGNTGGDIHVWLHTGKEWTSDYYVLSPDGVVNYDKVFIQKIKLDTTIDNTEYEIQLW